VLQKTGPLEPMTVRFAPLNQAIADIAARKYAKDAYPVAQVVGSKPINRMDVQFNQRVIHPEEALLKW